jgi:hypothetical protein
LNKSNQVLKANPAGVPRIPAALSVFHLSAGGEEISRGQRIFGFMPAEIFQELNFKHELNFQIFLEYVISPRTVIAIICFGYDAFLPGVALYMRHKHRSASPHPAGLAAPRLYLVPCSILAGTARWTGSSWPVRRVRSAEAVEMVPGLLLADVMEKTTLLNGFSFGGSGWVAGMKPFSILTLGGVVNPKLEGFVFGPDPEKVRQAHRRRGGWKAYSAASLCPNPGAGSADKIHILWRSRASAAQFSSMTRRNMPTEYLFDQQLYAGVIQQMVFEAARFAWLATEDIKDRSAHPA